MGPAAHRQMDDLRLLQCETPRWHEAREVTPAQWGQTFPEKDWVNAEALRVLESQ